MHRILVALTTFACVLGCATSSKLGGGETTERQKIINQSYFDLANCSPRPVPVVKPATKESLVGFLVSARPQVMECFVDPKNRGPAKETMAVVEATVNETAVTYKVSGQNLTPTGIQCVENLYKERKGLEPQPKGSAAITDKAEFHHVVGVSPSVVFGTNEASDVVGTVRLGQQGWCGCFADWAEKPPRTLKSELHLFKDKPKAEITFVPTTDPVAEKVSACLKEKLAATQFQVKSGELKVPYNFILVHSGVSEELPDAPNDVKFVQYEQLRAQRAADAVIALGARQNAASFYDALVQKYQKTKDYKMVKDLENGCAALGRANDAWISALTGQLEVDKRTLTLISSLKATDPQWGEAETKAQQTVAASEKDITEAKKIKDQNVTICPKKRL